MSARAADPLDKKLASGSVGLLLMPPKGMAWSDWRGPRRDGLSEAVPSRLPSTLRFAWRKKMTGPSMAGIAVSPPYLVVADKSANGDEDIWRCFDAQTGKELWVFQYAASGKLDYTNSPRATPVICDGKVYLLGAFGRLECVELATGSSIWSRDLRADYGGNAMSWGFCATPLVDGERLIVGTASPDAGLVAIHRETGETIWEAAGSPGAYGSLIAGEFGGRRQVVGYDSNALGGWDPATGQRLWTLPPKESSDLNATTPVNLGGRLLVSTESYGTRIYGFNPDGTICDQPLAQSNEFKPNASTPIALNGLLFGFASETLVCLDIEKLGTCWTSKRKAVGEPWGDYASLIGGNGRVLAASHTGLLSLFSADSKECRQISTLQVFDGKSPEVWSHPALMGDRLYLRSQDELVCVLLGE